jgi:hypothetical protein
MAYLDTCIDLFWKESNNVIKSPWRNNYLDDSPIACIMYYFAVKNNCPTLKLKNRSAHIRFHKFLAMDMKIAKMSITNLNDICKFFQIHIKLHSLDGYVDNYGIKQVATPIEVISLLFDGDKFHLLL